MPTRRLLATCLTLLALGALAGLPAESEARPVRIIQLDRDVPEADVIVIAKVTSSTFVEHAWFAQQWKGRQPPTTPGEGHQVDVHTVAARVLMSVKGAAPEGGVVTFRHRREPTPPRPMVNGFMSHAFELGANYLLILRKESDGVLAVPAPEQHTYATYPDALVPTLPAAANTASELVHVLRLLLARFDHGSTPDVMGVNCAAMVLRSKAGLVYAKAKPQRQRIIDRLKPLGTANVGTATHSGVLWMLHELGAPVPTTTIVAWILDPDLPQHVRTNLVGQLGRLPPATHVAVLEKVVAGVEDAEVAQTALRALAYARRALAEAESLARRQRAAEERRKARYKQPKDPQAPVK